jgi:hypothetical protein
MGISINCNDTGFCSSYSTWNEIREAVIKASFEYILDQFDKDKKLLKNVTEDDENWNGKGSYYDTYKTALCKANNQLFGKTTTLQFNNLLNNFNREFTSIEYMNSLNYFKIGGLLALCKQSDCEGIYTLGNSLDICILFDRIEPFLKTKDEYIYNTIYNDEKNKFCNSIYSIFNKSYNVLQNVIIT